MIPFAEGKYISVNKLSSCGITEIDVEDYIQSIHNFVEDKFFTINSLKKQGFNHRIENLGFGNYFYESIIIKNKNIKCKSIQNQRIYKFTDIDFSIEDFICSFEIPTIGIDIYNLIEKIKENYNIDVNCNYIISKLSNKKLYYKSSIGKLYNSYDEYLSNI